MSKRKLKRYHQAKKKVMLFNGDLCFACTDFVWNKRRTRKLYR